MHNQSSLIMCSSRWVLGALSRCRCCASNIHVRGASTLPSPWTWIMPRKSAAPRNARESCYWQPGGPSALRTSGRTNIISRTAHCLSDNLSATAALRMAWPGDDSLVLYACRHVTVCSGTRARFRTLALRVLGRVLVCVPASGFRAKASIIPKPVSRERA